MKPTRGPSLVPVALAALHATAVVADGTGFIGLGKTLYNPTCAFACRGVIKGCKLLCTPEDSSANHGTAHAPVSTPPDCFVKDAAFLKTMALCIDTYCPLSDNPSTELIEDYWASHLGTGTQGNYKWVPAMSYQEALAAAVFDEDEHRANAEKNKNKTETAPDSDEDDGHGSHGSKRLRARQFMTAAGPDVSRHLPIIKAKAPLNATSFIAPADWQLQYSGMLDFETNENGHTWYTISIMLIAIFLPVPLSLLRFVPGIANSQMWSAMQSALVTPAVYGKRHREPLSQVGLVPTRGQAMYIFLISILNLIFLLAPYVYHHPQSTFGSREEQELSIIGNRAGVMAMGNVVALFLFAARNNFLLWITDWSYSTYLLLHRWLGYWAVLHTVIHSFMLWFYYRNYGDYEAELARDYWVWGIVATVAVVAIFPSSLLTVRQLFYEFFLVSHFILALVFIIGYYYHIWYVYEYAWGYEIYAFIAAGIWATERLLRIVRIAFRGGYRSATVTTVAGSDGEYLRIDVEGVELGEGVAYLTFPTLGWRGFMESHPFSVAFHSSEVTEMSDSSPAPSSPVLTDKEANVTEKTVITTLSPVKSGPRTTFFARVRTGATSKLAARALSGAVRVGVVIDGPYQHSGGNVTSQLKQCSNIVYIAGGVGITALLPYVRHSTSLPPSQLYWSARKEGLVAAVRESGALSALPSNVEVMETVAGQRLDLDGILEKALVGDDGQGLVGIVVCGPAGMADHVRHKVVQISRNGPRATRPYVLVDEAFGW